jgi:hypothetical protein
MTIKVSKFKCLCVLSYFHFFLFSAAAPSDHHLLICGDTNHVALLNIVNAKVVSHIYVVLLSLFVFAAICFSNHYYYLTVPPENKILGFPLLKKTYTGINLGVNITE